MSETIERHFSTAELEARLEDVRAAPADAGRLELVVRGPVEGERDELDAGELDLVEGLVGDRWAGGKRGRTPDPATQLTLMSARAAELVAGSRERWALAGDQLYVDIDLSESNLPAGTRLAIGEVVVELSAEPHTGCKKFVSRFGLEAMLFVNSPEGRALPPPRANARRVPPRGGRP